MLTRTGGCLSYSGCCFSGTGSIFLPLADRTSQDFSPKMMIAAPVSLVKMTGMFRAARRSRSFREARAVAGYTESEMTMSRG